MKKRSIAMMLASVLAVFVLAVAPTAMVAAEGGSGTSSSGSGSGSGDKTHSGSDDGIKPKPGTGSGDAKDDRHSGVVSKTETETETENHDSSNDHKDGNGSLRFTGNKLKVCEQRKGNITSIIDRVVKRTQNQIDLFDKIATRTKTFYANKGKTLSNYDELVAAVTAAKTKAETDLQTIKNNSDFSCSSDDPSGDVSGFKAAVKQEIQDLKAYRTAVKNLIVGVKSVQGEESHNDSAQQ